MTTGAQSGHVSYNQEVSTILGLPGEVSEAIAEQSASG